MWFSLCKNTVEWIEAKPEAERYINTLHANESLKVGLFSKLAGTTYMQTFGDPMTVARRMDMYESGFYTEMMQELRDAAVDAQVAEMEMRSAYEEFSKKHKKWVPIRQDWLSSTFSMVAITLS